MAMTLPSPSSSDDSLPPPTPTTQSDPNAPGTSSPSLSAGANGTNTPVKRKPSRRANTAERRATHNAVERQRRETLNGRFLDLAALLPNLSQIRRPSKSSIVNSSIAHIHASRRHRIVASRELRALKHESDALRRELNEWRDRAGMPRVEETVRGDGFSMVLSGELEPIVVSGAGMEDDGDDLVDGYGMAYEDDVEYQQHPEMVEENRMAMAAMGHAHSSVSPPSTSAGHMPPHARIAPHPQGPTPQRPTVTISHASPHVGGPMIASPTAMSFENPTMGMYNEPQHISSSYPGPTFAFNANGVPQHPHITMEQDKVAAWNLYQQQQQMMIQQRPQHPADQAYLASLRQQRERSSSIASYHSGGGGGSPPHAPALSHSSGASSGSASPAQGYDAFDGTNAWMMGGKHQQQPQQAISVGGGGGGNSAATYAMMM